MSQQATSPTLLQLQTSLFQNNGQSSQLAESYASTWLQLNPKGRVIRRDLAAEPVPHLDAERFAAFTTAPEDRTADQRDVVAYSDALIKEIAESDVLVLAVPMYNFAVPSTLRTYFDHIARAGVTFNYTPEGPKGLLTGKKAYVFITRGGYYGEDHGQTNYLRQFLGFIGISDVEFIHAEGLAMNDAKDKSLNAARERIAQLA